MTVTIIIPTALRQLTDDEDELKLNARTVSDALKELVTAFPGLRRHLYSEGGRLRSFINIYLNEEDIRYKEGESTPLKDGDTLMIVPAVAGGSHAPVDDEGHGSRVSFSSGEFARYSRHLIMPEVGLEGQGKLKSASVLIIGAGGLGTPSATYLAAAGVGRIGIVDFDVIERSNLHRQVLYTEQDVGKSKADVARKRLLEINPNISVEVHKVRLDSSNALDILGAYDIILDGTDNFPTRYLVNDACVLLGKPNVYASIFRFDGQASVFYAREGPCYRCLYPEPPPPGLVPSCAEGGVLGVLPGIMGSIQAAEAIDLILGMGRPLIGRLVLFDALDMTFKELKLRKDPNCPVCGPNPTVKQLIDYEAFCGTEEQLGAELEVSPKALKQLVDEGKEVVVLDVREPFEYEIAHLANAKLIPLGELAARVNELDTARPIVVYCHTGQRSAQAVRFLNGLGFKKAKNLRGGIRAWGSEVDPTIQTY
ncbi:MAG TPA: molybdopterin-synthase adenylyltransferase MoeB [Nitrososphaerales archaeon]|nr:molybdopterin-synthase adenylyltransferase MoeB [Nitrososphaerales archaeon]